VFRHETRKAYGLETKQGSVIEPFRFVTLAYCFANLLDYVLIEGNGQRLLSRHVVQPPV